MLKKLFFFLFFQSFVLTICFSQNIANEDLVGTWYGPNEVAMTLEVNGTGYMELGSLKCQLKIVAWSATATVLSIRWDMTPIECYKPNSSEIFMHKPKIEFDKPEYTITKSKKIIGSITTTLLTLQIVNKEFNSNATWTRASDLVIPESE